MLVLTLQVIFTALFFVDASDEAKVMFGFNPTTLVLVALPAIAILGWCLAIRA